MKGNNIGGIINYFIYFWIFQIAAFVMLKIMGLVGPDSSLKHVLILFVILGIAYTGLYLVKKSGDRKRAARNENPEYQTKGTHIERVNKKGKKKKR